MGFLKRLVPLLCLMVFCSCTSSTHTFLTRTPPNRTTNPKKIAIFYGEPPRKAKAIAAIAIARDGQDATWAVEVLKMEAADIGADAITHLQMNYTTGIFATLRVQGVAVKYE